MGPEYCGEASLPIFFCMAHGNSIVQLLSIIIRWDYATELWSRAMVSRQSQNSNNLRPMFKWNRLFRQLDVVSLTGLGKFLRNEVQGKTNLNFYNCLLFIRNTLDPLALLSNHCSLLAYFWGLEILGFLEVLSLKIYFDNDRLECFLPSDVNSGY